ncbi:hypothetical protein [Clostridium peptidivorans]|uniref:hypothetical protein n=1 Tax=Clostridium peptidivorans TaxID=100174 RepID=UPI000BE475CA|nr:hypothetical protein [Clostridium peptidivorans]
MARCYGDDYESSRREKCLRCGNLLENPSFELRLTGWVTNNVEVTGLNVFEGDIAARMVAGASSMFQDVLLEKTCRKPLLVSFEMLPATGEGTITVGNLIVEVLWLNDEGEIIGTGLRTLIPSERTSNNRNRLTFVEITDTPPENAAMARLQLAKGATADNATNILDIDNIILAPIDSSNLIKNSGFQLKLANWSSTRANVFFGDVYEGTARVALEDNGTLIQNVPIDSFPRNSNFLLSFAVASVQNFEGGTFLKAQVIWLDRNGTPIGTGLDLSIDGESVVGQGNYTTYVDVTTSAPRGAVTAQIKFINTDKESIFDIDKVIFAKVESENLLRNPSFENSANISPWKAEGVTVVQSFDSYEGNRLARIAAVGGLISQRVPVEPMACYILNFGYEIEVLGSPGNLLVEVYWLDRDGQEIGIGLSIIIGPNAARIQGRWLTYLGVTEPAPKNAVRARIQFSKSAGITPPLTAVDIDKVVFARLA